MRIMSSGMGVSLCIGTGLGLGLFAGPGWGWQALIGAFAIAIVSVILKSQHYECKFIHLPFVLTKFGDHRRSCFHHILY